MAKIEYEWKTGKLVETNTIRSAGFLLMVVIASTVIAGTGWFTYAGAPIQESFIRPASPPPSELEPAVFEPAVFVHPVQSWTVTFPDTGYGGPTHPGINPLAMDTTADHRHITFPWLSYPPGEAPPYGLSDAEALEVWETRYGIMPSARLPLEGEGGPEWRAWVERIDGAWWVIVQNKNNRAKGEKVYRAHGLEELE